MSERHTIDARGAFCPGPLMELIAKLKLIALGDEIDVWSTDKGSAVDIPLWADKVGHETVDANECDGYWSVVIKKTK